MKWSRTIGSTDDSLWVTFRTAQSESLLAGRRTLFVPYIRPRALVASMRAFHKLNREIQWITEDFTAAVTTGAAVGVSGLAAARLHRVPAFFFESVSRVAGPSLSGRFAALDPGTRLHCQYPSWANSRWEFRGSLLGKFEKLNREPSKKPSLFVTLGTIQPYRFDAVVEALLATGLADDRTVWQVGATTREDLPGRVFKEVDASDFVSYARAADVVVCHAGVGTVMNLLEVGICPIVVPRRSSRKEHIDDHQAEIAQLLERLGISIVVEAPDLTADVVERAAGVYVCSK